MKQQTLAREAEVAGSVKPRLDTTIVKAMNIIEALAHAPAPLGVTELARMVELQKSNVHRVLNTMLELGYVRKEAKTGRYQLNLRLWELGSRIIDRSQLRRAARPFMRQLHEETSEFVYLTVLNGSDIVYLDTIEAKFPLRAGIEPGARTPIAFPASGKTVLAHQPAPGTLIDLMIDKAPGRKVDKAALLRELGQIRKSGFATSVSGWTRGRNSVAAPIMIGDRPPVAAIGIAGPTERMSMERLVALSDSVRNAATRIAETVGATDTDALF